jgi:hypothetical protein
MLRQVGAPAMQARARGGRRRDRVADRIHLHVHAEGSEPRARQRHRVASAPHRDVERAAIARASGREPRDPFDDERGR